MNMLRILYIAAFQVFFILVLTTKLTLILVSTAEFIYIVVSINVEVLQDTKSAFKVQLQAYKFGLLSILKLLVCKMILTSQIVRHNIVKKAQIIAISILSNSCGLTKIEVSGSKIYGLIRSRNLCNFILFLAVKLTFRQKLIVGHIYISISALDIKENKFASIF